MARNRNYVPHSKCYYHRETRHSEEDYENWLKNLSATVGEACEKFLRSRKIKVEPFVEQRKKKSEVDPTH
jgi:hypothetical protein